ncbi:unnamed protein product [Penicillium pancosmium]
MEAGGDLAVDLVTAALSSGIDPISIIVNLLVKDGVMTVQTYLDHRASKHFIEEIKILFVRLTERGYIEPLIPQSPVQDKTAPIGWIMTPKGVDSLFFSIYHDIDRGRNALGLSNARLKTLGVYQPLIVNLNSQSKGTAIRSRLGITYPPQYRKWMLEHINPFQYLPTYEKWRIGLYARGMVRRALQSEGQQDRLLARALGLAQFCGLGEISLADLMELLAHTCHYERVARRYLAGYLGVHHSIFTGYALRDCLPGPQLGSLQNPIENFAQIFPTFYNSLVLVGVIERGKPRINRVEEMRNVRFRIDSGTFITEGEPIYMISGWATALIHRPQNHPQNRSIARDFTVGLLRDVGMELVPPPARLRVGNLSGKVSGYDVHGNPHYFSAELETIWPELTGRL